MKTRPPPAATTPAKKPGKPVRRANLPGEIRIIGGLWKRTKLTVPDVEGLRPTPDRVRETLFNWLGQDLAGWRCVDMFAGSGVLGFEAASRGASEVRLFESAPTLLAQLAKVQARLDAGMVQIARGDGIALAGRLAPASVDLVFLDPPFTAPLYEAALAAALRVLAPTGRIYLEAPERWSDERLAAQGVALERYLKAGAVHAHLLARAA
jgi:16S rRNA (guanine966-N2)-methyltransferase